MQSETSAYLAASAGSARLVIPLSAVQEVVSMPRVTAVPRVPPCVRGIINLWGGVIRLVDLRVLLGLRSLRDEFDETDKILAARLEDHQRWIAELEACVRENKPFKLARDPHKCAFGKWYDSYKPENDAIAFQQFWRSFDGPHQAIHGVANAILDLAARGQTKQALEQIELKRSGELASLIALFSRAGTMMRQTNRELAILLRVRGEVVAVSADRVQTVVQIPSSQIEPLPTEHFTVTRLIRQTARLPNSSQVHLLLDVEPLLDSLAA